LSAATLKQTNDTRVQPRGDRRSVDIGVAGALDWADETDAQVTTVALATDSTAADALVQSLLESLPRGRRRRAFEELTDKDGWDRYLRKELEAANRWKA
jgi:microcystin degradation protein MlrC